MIFRDFLKKLEKAGVLAKMTDGFPRDLCAAEAIIASGGRPVLLPDVDGMPVVSNLLSTRSLMAAALGMEEGALASAFDRAMSSPSAPTLMKSRPPCQEVVRENPDLHSTVPILRHFRDEGGPYVTAGVMIVDDPDLGPNAAFHRLMSTGPRTFTARLVEGRGTDTAWRKAGGPIPAAVCIGPPAEVLLAAAAPAPSDVDEMAVANAFNPVRAAKCVSSGLVIPADSEWVLEGRLLRDLDGEGPFVDITRMLDPRRMQPVFEVDVLTRRKAPFYHAVLPGGAEHRLLMGMPRELAVISAVSRAADPADFRLTEEGCGWLAGVLAIRKRAEGDPMAAARAAMGAHGSMKLLTIVDDDVDPSSPGQVAWAVATRLRPGKDVTILPEGPCSSLDPSADHPMGGRSLGSKMILDATIKEGPGRPRDRFKRIY